MDDRLDTFLQDTYTWILRNAPYYGSIAYNYATTLLTHLFHLSRITTRAVIHAHMPSSWVFLGRNTYPVMLKEGDMNSTTLLTYNPTLHAFGPMPPMSHLGNVEGRKRQTVDVVTAELVDASGIVFHDMSSFFYSVNWLSDACGPRGPSILELVLVFALENQFYLPLATLDTYTVRIFDSNCETHEILLASDAAREPFMGFEQAATAVAAVETVEEAEEAGPREETIPMEEEANSS